MTIATDRSPTRVLVVDDDADTVDTTALFLEMQGYAVGKAYDGAQAIEQAVSFCPHATLLDIGMPDMDGFEVAHRLQEITDCTIG